MRIHLVQQLLERLYIEASKSSVGGQTLHGVAHIEFLVVQPEVRLHGNTAPVNGIVERSASPIIVVGMTRYREHISRSIARIMYQRSSCVARFAPIREE